MRKFKKLLLVSVITSTFLLGCGKEAEVIKSSDLGLDIKTEKVLETEPSVQKNEVNMDGKIRSQVTNLPIDEDLLDHRPISVVIPNDPSALPHYSISDIGVLYQFPVEGNISRLLGIVDDWQDLEKIGNIRSAREYFLFAGLEWDPIFCHFGNAVYADNILAAKGTDNVDALKSADDVYFRTTDRKRPQNAYFKGEGILNGIEDRGYSLKYTENHIPNHFTFANENQQVDLTDVNGSVDGSKIDLAGSFSIDKTYVEYDESTQEYLRHQYGKPHIDKANNQQLSFKNIIIQETKVLTLDASGYLAVGMHDNTRGGYFFTNGKGIPVTWEKPISNNFAPTKYYDESGEEITLNTGKTMIFIVNEDDTYSFE